MGGVVCAFYRDHVHILSQCGSRHSIEHSRCTRRRRACRSSEQSARQRIFGAGRARDSSSDSLIARARRACTLRVYVCVYCVYTRLTANPMQFPVGVCEWSFKRVRADPLAARRGHKSSNITCCHCAMTADKLKAIRGLRIQ